ncbi:MAG: hypothetical protein K8I02_05470 [Candidatus Methylomirabilis sp.]|nr:hypothetical protein [Deltaproteobacteria bacterium]
MSQKDELKDRLLAKKKKLEAKLHEARADARKEGRESAKDIEKKLGEIDKTLKEGWDNLSESVMARINKWLSD